MIQITLRRMGRSRLVTGINILGLTASLSCAMLIWMFVAHERSYDRFIPDADRVYRIVTQGREGSFDATASTFRAVGPAALSSIPEVESAVRIKADALSRPLVTTDSVSIYVDDVIQADAGFLEMFGRTPRAGTPTTLLVGPNQVVLTDRVAGILFGSEDPTGRIVSIYGEDYEVTGVVMDVPDTSHLRAGIIASMATEDAQDWWRGHEWRLLGYYTYVRLIPGADPDAVARRLADLAPSDPESPTAFHLQPVTSIHLHSALDGELTANSDIRYLWLFGAVAVLVILIACGNYANLATVEAARRSSGTAVRMILGAGKRHVLAMNVTESLLVSVCALVLAYVATELALPWFNGLTGKELALTTAGSMAWFPVAALVVAVLAGVSPSVTTTAVPLVRLVRDRAPLAGMGRGRLMKALVVFQFATTIALVLATLVIQRQLDYVLVDRLGFAADNLIVLHDTKRLDRQVESFKEHITSLPGVASVTTSTNIPGQPVYNVYRVNGPESGDSSPFYVEYNQVDTDFVRTVGLSILDGRDVSEEYGLDRQESILINQATAGRMGWESPVGQRFMNRTVVGVVQDYLAGNSRSRVQPAAYVPFDGAERFVIVRLDTDDVADALDQITLAWERVVPDSPIWYSFVDADIEAMYRSDQRLAAVFATFSILALIIACLGLFGLAAHAALHRTKEIGIRKALGASELHLVALVSREFLLLVSLSMVLGLPVAWIGVGTWLEDFAYRVEPGVMPWLASAFIVVVTAAGVTGFNALRAARANPVDCLRSE